MVTYSEYRKAGLSLDCLGFSAGPETGGYFCTPLGARVVGWTGVDGGHFCLVPDFGEQVFAVGPMNGTGNYVNLIARSFEDFLRLLLACGHTAALEQAWFLDEAQFRQFLADDPPTAEQAETLGRLRGTFGLTPMPEPYAYLKEVGAELDLKRLRFPPEYYDSLPSPPQKPAWKVRYDGGFFGGTGRAGKEVPVNVAFPWGREIWHVPAVYLCAKGLVADLCVQIAPERYRAFWEKWGDRDLTPEEQRLAEAEDPLDLEFCCEAALGTEVLPSAGSYGAASVPGREEGDAKWVLEHYGLDPSQVWVLYRVRFPWEARPKKLSALSLTLRPRPIWLPGDRFLTPEAGGSLSLRHPLTGAETVLTVEEAEQQSISRQDLGTLSFTQMAYRLDPETRGLRLRDVSPDDPPRPGADGPVALILSAPHSPGHWICSKPRRFPPERVEWLAEWSTLDREVRNVTLI